MARIAPHFQITLPGLCAGTGVGFAGRTSTRLNPSVFRSRLGLHCRCVVAAAASTVVAAAWSQVPDGPTTGAASPPSASRPPNGGAPPARLDTVTVTSRVVPVASVSGWGDLPLADTPLQATVLNAEQMRDFGIARLADITAIDPAVSDAYNAVGYYDYLTVRGFVLDNRFNFRRDGLPINAETAIPLDNKGAIEILKGITGLQAGTSTPGGLVNYVVKRPLDTPLRAASLEWRQPGNVTGAVDISQRFGVDAAFGVRMNAAAARLDSWVRSSTGNRQAFAVAADWRLGRDTLLEAEIESSHQSQPSQPGFSMLGNIVPPPGDPRINLNDQPWTQPVVFHATTGSLRWQQRLTSDWRFVAHAMTQHLRSDDRLAYPFGCSSEGNYDRYCSDGSFDLYDFHSDNERRRSDALQFTLEGRAATGPIGHRLAFGLLETRFRSRLQPQLDDNVIVGQGTVDGATLIPNLPALDTVANTDRSERSTELSLRDAVALTDHLTAWLGLRHTRIARSSVATDGSEPTAYHQSFNTPFAAVSYAVAPQQLLYASWGRGVESEVVPNRAKYSNAGQPLPSLQSRQTEVGLKGASERFAWNVAWFDIVRPYFGDFGSCADAVPCQGAVVRAVDGSERHRGVEASGSARLGALTVGGGIQWLRARRQGSASTAENGLTPTNVPARTAKLGVGYDVASVPGLRWQANLMFESRRMVLPDNSASIPAVTRVDAGARYATLLGGTRITWRAGIDNLFDRRAWRESPYEYGHVYLYPLAPRTLRLSVETSL